MSELKPCPFCGGTDIKNDDGVGSFGESIIRYAAKCEICGVSFWHPEIGCGNQPAETWFDWNTRPIEDELHQRIAELEAKLARVRQWSLGYGIGCKHRTWGDLDRILSGVRKPLAVAEKYYLTPDNYLSHHSESATGRYKYTPVTVIVMPGEE